MVELLLGNNTFVLSLLPQVVKRGMAPGGGGEVVFSCPTCKTLSPVQLTDPGKIKRIRGVAYPSCKVPFSICDTVEHCCGAPVRSAANYCFHLLTNGAP